MTDCPDTKRRRKPPPLRRIRWLVVALAIATASAVVTSYASWGSSSDNPTNALTAASLGAPGSLNAATPDACTTVNVTWTVASEADRYRVEVQTANGPWSTLSASQTALNYSDTTGYTNSTLTYRVTSLLIGTAWEGPAQTTTITCGIGEVNDLAAQNPCSSTTLAWTAPTGATNYDIQRRINGGAWAAKATDQVAPSYTDAQVYTPGSLIEYQVRPGNGATNGNWSNTASIASWEKFRATSVTFSDVGGTVGTLQIGDTITVTFSKPADPATAAYSNIRITGRRNLFLPITGTGLANTQIGQAISPTTNFYGVNALYAGTVAWSAGNTVWTWTSTVSGTTMGTAAGHTWSVGTHAGRVKCATDNTALLDTPDPTTSGRW